MRLMFYSPRQIKLNSNVWNLCAIISVNTCFSTINKWVRVGTLIELFVSFLVAMFFFAVTRFPFCSLFCPSTRVFFVLGLAVSSPFFLSVYLRIRTEQSKRFLAIVPTVMYYLILVYKSYSPNPFTQTCIPI